MTLPEFPKWFLDSPSGFSGEEHAALLAAGDADAIQLRTLRQHYETVQEQIRQNENAIAQTMRHIDAEVSAMRERSDVLAGDGPARAKLRQLEHERVGLQRRCEPHRAAIKTLQADLAALREQVREFEPAETTNERKAS